MAENLPRPEPAVARLVQLALSGVELTTLMREAVTAVVSGLGTEYASIFEMLPGGRQLRVRESVGWNNAAAGTLIYAEGSSQAGGASPGNGAGPAADLSSETRLTVRRLLLDHKAESVIWVIIPGKDGPFGTLGACTATRRTFTAEDNDFLQALANIVGQAIERQRTEEKLKHSEEYYRLLIQNSGREDAKSDAVDLEHTHGKSFSRAQQHAAVAQLGQLALTGIELTVLMREAVTTMVFGLGADYGSILELVPGEEKLRVRENVGWSHDAKGTLLDANKGSQGGYTLLRNEAVLANDLSTERRFAVSQLLLDHKVASAVSVVIRGKDQPFGTMGAGFATKRTFTREDADFIQALANILGQAIERRRAEKKLKQSEEYYRLLIQNSSDVILFLSADGTVRFVSDSCERFFGCPPATFVSHNSLEFVHPDDVEKTRAVFAKALKTLIVTRPVELRLRHADGSWLYHEVITTGLADLGGRPGVVLNSRDISERKRAEAAQALLASIVDATEDAIQSVDSSGVITSWNPAGERLLGYSPAEAIGRRLQDLGMFPPGRLEEKEQYLALVLAGAGAQHFETQRLHKDGRLLDAAVTLVPLHDSSGKLSGVASLVRDITEMKRATRELAQAHDAALESSRLKSAFIANMSHEIRTPLNIIVGYSQLIADHLAELGDRSQSSSLDAIGRASERLTRTINSILDISRIEAGAITLQPVSLEIALLLERLMQDFRVTAESKGITLSSAIETTGVNVVFDEYCLSQALTNLLDNAIKFTDRGAVTLRLYHATDGTLCLELRDTGVGIGQEFLPKLFTPFSQEQSGNTRRFEGTGLGLTLVRKYLELNGASISVESERDKGTTFTVSFSKENAARKSPEPLRQSERRTAPRAILIVEDDRDTQAFMRATLAQRYEVLAAASAEEARQVLEAHPDVSLILMDLELGGAEDGLDLTRSLRAERRWMRVPILALTAYATLEDRSRALAAGCDDFVAKPIARNGLIAKIDGLLARLAK
jgi:PAS domain S-box-containing protein